MTNNGILELIETHNSNIAGFENFCKKLGEINGGGLPVDKWFQLWQVTPRFTNHAELLVKAARTAGIDAGYTAQNGKIYIYGGLKKRGDL